MTAPAQLPLGTRIKIVRIASGLTQRALAARLDMPPSSLSIIETGIRPPTEGQLRGICAALGVERQDLVAGSR
jgi:transcriptional regulator with XRE-family HTH domain